MRTAGGNRRGRAVKGIEFEKLYEASKVAHERDYEEWLEKARVLSRSEFKKEVDEAKAPRK